MIYKLSKPLVLASASPRRKELLADAGFEFVISSSDIDETVQPDEAPADLVLRLAIAKAKLVAQKFPEHFVLGADTDVALGNKIFGKPSDKQQAVEMLKQLSGSTHNVLGAIALVNKQADFCLSTVSETKVTFRDLSNDEIFAYADSPEPYDKAGGYAAQGIGAAFIKSIQGSYSNVVGLDLSETIVLFKKAKILD